MLNESELAEAAKIRATVDRAMETAMAHRI